MTGELSLPRLTERAREARDARADRVAEVMRGNLLKRREQRRAKDSAAEGPAGTVGPVDGAEPD